ncbi:cache domain-containing protein [Paenibacillus cellulositrophicus]|uniref:cache domain-containing protein n=1 Tax=Paenibacillus cellulositrophicus TaxID=562959 RepID=UPI003D985F0F
MQHWFGTSLKHKLSLLTILAALVPLLFLGIFSYKMAESLTEEKAKTSGMNNLRQLDVYLETMVKDVENMSLFLIGNEGVQSYLKSSESNYVQQTAVINFLTSLAFSKDYIANIIVEPLGAKDSISYKSLVRSEFQDVTERDPDYYAEHPKWWSSVHRQWTFEGVRKMITLARPIRSTDKYKPIGNLQINLDQRVIASQVRQVALEKTGFVLLLDENNRILAGPRIWKRILRWTLIILRSALLRDRAGIWSTGRGAARRRFCIKRCPVWAGSLSGSYRLRNTARKTSIF